MKKYPTGFVPVNFKAVGKIFLVISALTFTLFGFNYFLNILQLSNFVLFFGIAVLLLGVYLIYVVPREN